MRLESFSVRDFRSIRRAATVPVRAGVTVLLGPNNEGKSNILRALALAVETIEYLALMHRRGRPIPQPRGEMTRGEIRVVRPRLRGPTDYEWARDYPRDLQESSPDGETVVRLTYALNHQDCLDIAIETGRHITEKLPIELSFGPRDVRVRIPKRRWGPELSRQAAAIAGFISARSRFEYIPAVRTHRNATKVIDDLLAVRLSVLEDQPDYVHAIETIRRLQEPVLAQVAEEMTSALQVFLPAVRSVRVELSQDLRYERMREPSAVIVDDGVPTPLSSKGDGVISLAAIGLMRRAVARGRARQAVLAIEEPEAHLHPQAVHLLRDAMNDIGRTQQVILTTHSPLFVDRTTPTANVIVRSNTARAARSLQEIRDALGVCVTDNLSSAETVLFVEGPTDKQVVEALFRHRSDALCASLDDGRLAVQVLGGCSKLAPSVYAIDRSVIAWHCLLDNDREAKECVAALYHERTARPAQITHTVFDTRAESEIEDWIKADCYEAELTERYGPLLESQGYRNTRGKWSARMARAFSDAGMLWETHESEVKWIVAQAASAAPEEALRREADGPFSSLIEKLTPSIA